MTHQMFIATGSAEDCETAINEWLKDGPDKKIIKWESHVMPFGSEIHHSIIIQYIEVDLQGNELPQQQQQQEEEDDE